MTVELMIVIGAGVIVAGYLVFEFFKDRKEAKQSTPVPVDPAVVAARQEKIDDWKGFVAASEKLSAAPVTVKKKAPAKKAATKKKVTKKTAVRKKTTTKK